MKLSAWKANILAFASFAAAIGLGGAAPARASDLPGKPDIAKLQQELGSPLEGEIDHPDEFDTRHIFGMTEGADIGEAGEREALFSTSASIGKTGGGRYGGVEQDAACEHVLNDRFAYEFSLHGVALMTSGVPGVANFSQTTMSGLSFQGKYILLKRGTDGPVGVAVSVAPQFDSVDPVIGANAHNLALPVKLMLDTELLRDQLYLGSNVLFSPAWNNETGHGFSQYALFGLTGALTYRLSPKVALGAQAEYDNVASSLGFANWTGWASYIGPTLHVQVTENSFVSASWSSQIAGKPAYNSAASLAAYNASDLARQRGALVFGAQF